MFRDYRNCMFRSEWLNDAKFKSLVANDRTDWCLKVRKGKSESALSRSQIESPTLTATLTVALTMTLQQGCQNCDFFLLHCDL